MFRCQMEKPVGIPTVCRHSNVEVVREPCLCGSLCHLFMHLFSILNTPPFSGSQVFINIPVGLGNSIRCKLKTAPDRKSTRLNSSHVAISYAVFCLKKKNANDC